MTKRLAEHATCNLRNRRYLQTIQWLINKLSRHMGESMVTVTTAKPLTDEQVNKWPSKGRSDCRQVIDGGGDQVVGGVVEAQQL